MEVTESDEDDRKYLAKLREELDTSRQIREGGARLVVVRFLFL